jgi:Ca2+-transporting ATPase
MITGDHPLTASYIANELGIASNNLVLTGQDLQKMSDGELSVQIRQVSVFARVSPEHKLRIVQLLQEQGEIVAMTGDGVNDAPALKKADIGVAMGITGTDVSKEAADMVLTDDNFATIVSAVEEGRTIYDNLRKFIKFSLAGNLGKVLVVMLGPLLGPSVPLLPLQLLFLNLLTDGLLGLGLGLEKAEKGLMKRSPYSPRESVLPRSLFVQLLWIGGVIGAVALAVGGAYLSAGRVEWQTMIFVTLTLAQILQAFASRSGQESFFFTGWLSNKALTASAAIVLALLALGIYMPFFQALLKTHPLRFTDLLVSAGASGLVFALIELEKWLVRKRNAGKK